MVDPKNRQLRPPIHRSWLRLRVGKAYYVGKRYLLWCDPRYHWARVKEKTWLPNIYFSHETPLYRHLRGEDMVLQENKAGESALGLQRSSTWAAPSSGETFSYWKTIGNQPGKKVPGWDGAILGRNRLRCGRADCASFPT